MVNRINQIIAEKNITVAQFSDLLGIQRSGMSHILNGRNNPSLHIVKRILEVYQEINPKWLIFGEGDMYLNNQTEKSKPEKKINHKNLDFNKDNENPSIQIPNKEKMITKVIIFYSDNTFEINYPL